MSKKEPAQLVQIKYLGRTFYLVYDKKIDRFVLLDENRLSRARPGYNLLNEKARQREFNSFVKDSELIRTFTLSEWLPNAPLKLCLERLPPGAKTDAVQTILSLSSVFESPKPGYLLLADMLCGLHGAALRKAEPTFSPTIAIRSDSPEILSALKKLIKSVVSISRWKRKKVRIQRAAILDYRVRPGEFPRHIQDFSQTKCSAPGYKKPRFPAAYTDTVALMIGADNAQVREAAPYFSNAAVVMLNCGSGDLAPTRLSSADISAYNPDIVQQLKINRKAVSTLLSWWWAAFEDEDAWAQLIVQKARASFGKPASHYVRVELDPKRLRDAIRYQVLLSFFDNLDACGLATAKELQPYRQGAKDVFDPAPPEAVVRRHVEDPAVFLEIMRDLTTAKADSIIPEGTRFVKKDNPFAAWRTISGERYLVIPEDTWVKVYKKEVLARKELDASFLQVENWERKFQRILSENGKIKKASSGYRYRYDLYEDGTRDSTYVVAIPAQFLEN